MNDIAYIIPAYNPSDSLLQTVSELSVLCRCPIIVVNDGSSLNHNEIFNSIKGLENITVLAHAVNLGKGAALKTGLNHAYCEFSNIVGVVTVDADGQHLVNDAIKVKETLECNSNSLVLGTRTFEKSVPLRSKIGNTLTCKLFSFLVGRKLNDTQTGLRGIPRSMIPELLKVESNGYEFELDMLLLCKYGDREIIQKSIETVYLDENKSSHFNPLVDSLKIYFVLFRFGLVSLFTALIDYTIFYISYHLWSWLLVSQIAARAVAMVFNYTAVKRSVFYSQRKNSDTFPKYLLLVIISGILSYNLIQAITLRFGIPVIIAKATAEFIIFLANFAVQRDLIFTRRGEINNQTDWDSYYKKPYKTASVTRRFMLARLLSLINNFTPNTHNLKIAELGGANSCFVDDLIRQLPITEYHIYDNNDYGLKLLSDKFKNDHKVVVHNSNILNVHENRHYDVVYSVGLIEHFDSISTAEAIKAHFKLLRQGGILIITFPTPTFIYNITRKVSELLGLWIFHDERPLRGEEVMKTALTYGELLHNEILWRQVLTQQIMVFKLK